MCTFESLLGIQIYLLSLGNLLQDFLDYYAVVLAHITERDMMG